MAVTRPTVLHMGISDARAKLTSVVNGVYRGETRIVVEKSGIPVAVVISPGDLARLDRLDRREAEDWAFVDEIRARFADVSEDELMRRAVESVREVRAEKRARREAQEQLSANQRVDSTAAVASTQELAPAPR